ITGGNIATWAFGACTSLESIELPANLTNLKKRTFSGCTSLMSIELPETVTTLGDRVFIGCTALESVKLSGITKIDVQTFNNCRSISSITIPETVTSIGDLAFRLNENLKTVYIDSATIAAGLTGNAVYGNMIKWAETIAIRADINAVPTYVKANYPYTDTVVVGGKRYTTYSKTAKIFNLKMEDYILNTSVHTPQYLNGGFEAYTDYGRHHGSDNMNQQLVADSIQKLGLGSLYYAPFDGGRTTAGEWGYTFLNLNGSWAGDGMYVSGAGWLVNTPKSDADALSIIKNWLFTQYAGAPYHLYEGSPDTGAFNGHTHWQHYTGEWGLGFIGAEIGENIASHQAHLAFTRGAAKQYGTYSALYFSNWYQSTIGTWEEQNSWPGWGDVNGGHSMSLLKRAYMMSYMGGVSTFAFEAGGRLAFYGPSHKTADGCYELSPYGQAMQELVGFSTKNEDVGLNYAPIGIVLDYYHGISGYTNLGTSVKSHDKAFGYFNNTAGDKMTWDLFEMYYPGGGLFGGYMSSGIPGEEKYQVNTPYGDTCDVLLQNASATVLNSYPVLLLSGDMQLSTQEVNRYISYVKQGGTLLLNTAYLSQFSRYNAVYTGGTRQDVSDGKGKVIIYGPNYSVANLGAILKEQLAKHIPFTFSTDVEYLVNVKDGSLIVTVINNAGVTKERLSAPVVDYSKTKTLTINYTGALAIKQVKELYYGEAVSLSGNTVTTTIGPGDYRVFEFVFD
ncbi:MAG: leucine-rich repeat domain-containing protein, partial [Clostridia bacterium]|nr:leucine-rich repeat domain-containing protein [Clostridia bacterium]